MFAILISAELFNEFFQLISRIANVCLITWRFFFLLFFKCSDEGSVYNAFELSFFMFFNTKIMAIFSVYFFFLVSLRMNFDWKWNEIFKTGAFTSFLNDCIKKLNVFFVSSACMFLLHYSISANLPVWIIHWSLSQYCFKRFMFDNEINIWFICRR